MAGADWSQGSQPTGDIVISPTIVFRQAVSYLPSRSTKQEIRSVERGICPFNPRHLKFLQPLLDPNRSLWKEEDYVAI